MLQQFNAQAFTTSNATGTTTSSLQDVVLVDSDFARGNGATETVTIARETAGTPPLEVFDGFINFVFTGPTLGSVVREFESGEVSTLVTFSDGTSISGVRGLYDITVGSFGSFFSQHLLDQSALTAAGKTLADVASITNLAFVNHGLNWADLGFTATGIAVPDPEPEPEPEPEPVLNPVLGSARNDRLFGTAGDDLIRGGGNDDRVTGRGGADTFAFGADARDRDRDRDVITDFNAAEDTILFEAGVRIRFIEQRGANLFIQLEGDRDSITVLNADRGAVANFEFSADILLV